MSDIKNLSPKKMVEDLGISYRHAYEITKRRRTPSKSLAKKIEDTYGIDKMTLLYPIED